jgi:hypothetical protein
MLTFFINYNNYLILFKLFIAKSKIKNILLEKYKIIIKIIYFNNNFMSISRKS